LDPSDSGDQAGWISMDFDAIGGTVVCFCVGLFSCWIGNAIALPRLGTYPVSDRIWSFGAVSVRFGRDSSVSGHPMMSISRSVEL
jgi:hypothetical protein